LSKDVAVQQADHRNRTRTSRRWHVLRDGAAVTLARHLPARFDIGVTAVFPMMGRLRLAQEVRQDMWRVLQHVRGFSPVIRVEAQGDRLSLRAGGRVVGPVPKAVLEARIAALLDDPDKRVRWGRFAGGRA